MGWVAGGYHDGALRSCEILVDRSWKDLPNLNVARDQCALVTSRDRIYCVGGRSDEAQKTMEVYDDSLHKWILLNTQLPQRYSSPIVECINNTLYILGGENTTKCYSAVVESEGRIGKWKPLKDIPIEPWKGDSAVWKGTNIVVAGLNQTDRVAMYLIGRNNSKINTVS